MSPADQATLWKAESKMLCPVSCHQSRSIRGDRRACYDTISRSKPGFPLSSPVPDKQYRVTRASLYTKRPKSYLHGSLMQEQHLPVYSSIFALPKDQEDIVECFESDTFHSKPFLDDLIIENGYYFGSEDTVCVGDEGPNLSETYWPVEEPWLLDRYGTSHYATEGFNACHDLIDGNGSLKILPINGSQSELSSKKIRHGADSYNESEKVDCQINIESSSGWSFSDRDHPVEDPWLLYSLLEVLEADVWSIDGASPITEPAEDGENLLGPQEQRHQVTEKLLSERESNLISHQDSISTEILINCSICTMQRIAVLEDGNVVELLLEPVKSNVQCDTVYLGVVTKLVPHMGGAFVNIGSSRPSLMSIKHTREPFIFPPFDCTTKEKEVNGSPSSMLEKHLDSNHNEETFLDEDDTEVFDEDTEVDFEEDDFEDHDHDNGTGGNIGASVNQLNENGDYAKAPSHVRGRKGTKSSRIAEQTWAQVRKGTKILVQVVKEGLGTKGPTVTPYPKLRSRFWILIARCKSVGVSKKIIGVERTRLRVIAKSLQPPGFGVTLRTVAAGHSMEELRKDLEGLLSTWRNIIEHAKSAALAADEGVEGAVPVILHQAMGQTLSVVQDYFSEKVKRMVVDSPRTYHEVTNYLQDIAPELCDRVELHRKKVPLFDEFNIEEEINNILNKRVALPNGGSLVIEQTEALVSIDVNGGHGMFGEGASQEKAILDVNLAAARQIARELRLRDIGGIIVVDFIDMVDEANKRLVYEEVKKAVERDRSMVKVSELSKHGLMEITRKRVRPSVTFMISEPCTCCHGTGRVEALETSFSKIEHEICRLLATMDQKADPGNPKSWPRLLLRVDSYMCDYLTSGKKTRLATLSSSLKVWILLKVARNFTRGAFEVKLFVDDKAIDNQHHQGDVSASQQPKHETSMPTKRTKLFPVKKWKAGRK